MFFSIGFIVAGAVGGAGAGLLQQILVRRHISTIRWALASAMGGALGGAVAGIGLETPALDPSIAQLFWSGVPLGIASGALAGTLQWRDLRQRLAGAVWWPLACIVGWAVGGVMVWPVSFFLIEWVADQTIAGEYMFYIYVLMFPLAQPLVGAVAGVITGTALVWILRTKNVSHDRVDAQHDH